MSSRMNYSIELAAAEHCRGSDDCLETLGLAQPPLKPLPVGIFFRAVNRVPFDRLTRNTKLVGEQAAHIDGPGSQHARHENPSALKIFDGYPIATHEQGPLAEAPQHEDR